MKTLLAILCAVVLFSCPGYSGAENTVFIAHLEKITRLEMELKILDMELNRPDVLSSARYQYVSRIVSVAGKDTITSILYVFPSLMKIAVKERKKRISDICNSLFEEYGNRFWMTDPDYKKAPGEIGTPLGRMKSCNMAVYVYTEYPRNNLLASWECGILSYRKDFLKK
jgi:hypothetical protein